MRLYIEGFYICFLLRFGLTVIFNMAITNEKVLAEMNPAKVEISNGVNKNNNSCQQQFQEPNNACSPQELLNVTDHLMGHNASGKTPERSAIVDFQCRGDLIQTMKCKFTVPDSRNNYKLYFKANTKQEKECPLQNGSHILEKTCSLGILDYSPVYSCYNFIIVTQNSSGIHKNSFTLDLHSKTVPVTPNVVVKNVSVNSATLQISMNHLYTYNYLTNGLKYEIRLWSETIETFYTERKTNFEYTIENLKNSYQRYNYSVRARTLKSNICDESMWSEAFVGNFVTEPKIPDSAPKMEVGSFYIDSSAQRIRLYWEKLPEHQKNGPNFRYNLTEVRRDGQLVNPTILLMDDNSALLTYTNTSHYTFKLSSQNQCGVSLNSSILDIHPYLGPSKQKLIKIYHQQNQTYTVIWNRPTSFNRLNNFTLLSCIAKPESNMDCMGKIKLESLNKETRVYRTIIPNKRSLNFALSENYETHSTGMIWAICSLNFEPTLKNIVFSDIITSADTIILQWKNECWYSYAVKFFNLAYCMDGSLVGRECVSGISKKSVPVTVDSFRIENLHSSTSYKIWFSMHSKQEDGPTTSVLVITTAEKNYAKIISVIVMVLFIFSAPVIVLLSKKCIIMKNIQYIIPNGLVDYEDEKLKKINLIAKKNIYHYSIMDQNNIEKNLIDNSIPYKQEEMVTLKKNMQPGEENSSYLTKPSLSGYIAPSNIMLKNELHTELISKKQLLDMSQSSKILWVLLAWLSAIVLVSANPIGDVTPKNVDLPIGGNVNITCQMNRFYFGNRNSSCLYFVKDDNFRVPETNIQVVNDSAIIFMIRNATEPFSRYTCKCDDKGVNVNTILVGTPPTNVTDFQCRGYDFSYITCNFTAPKNNIFTEYKLVFTINAPNYFYPCTLESGHGFEKVCNISMEKNNYRVIHQYYTFQLTANNSLGVLTQQFKIDQFSRIVPAKPLVQVENITTNGVTLHWSVTKCSLYNHTNGLQYEIRLRPERFDWFNIDTNSVLKLSDKNYKAEINNLKYSKRRYDFIIRAKTVIANNSDETMWSEPYEGHFYTLSKKPDRAPNMDVGSFYIDPNEKHIRIYWQQIAEYEENGPDFMYNITEIIRDGQKINIEPLQKDLSSATFEWQKQSHYKFKVQSQNRIGMSANASSLEVHPSRTRSRQMEQIQYITKAYHSKMYTITWRQPFEMGNLRNYTLFWCLRKMESQMECKGTINFKHFDKYTSNHTTKPQNDILNFALSANYETYSTGMMWAECNADGDKELVKIIPDTTPISSTSIKVQWITECLYTAILEGFNLTYCRVENSNPDFVGNCTTTEQTITISRLSKEYIITGLEPYSTYRISILMYTKHKVGPMSNPVTETTMEDAPTPPRQLKKYDVTSDSVTLTWLAPEQFNGNLRYYTVWYKNESIDVKNTTNSSEITFKLSSLSSYSDYKVNVTAHTVKKSLPSNEIHFTTLIGIPSPPLLVNLSKNNKELTLRWSPPEHPSGRLDFYEVRVSVSNNNESKILKISYVGGTSCVMNIPCYDPNNSYNFDVRAVNVDRLSEENSHTFSRRDTSASYFNTIHQGAGKTRRHSNAEINTSSGSSNLLRHRNERGNPTDFQIIEPTLDPLTYKIYDEFHDQNNDNFGCIEEEKDKLNSEIIKQYRNENLYRLYYSVWQIGPYFACDETKFSKLTMLALVVIIVTMLLLATVYYARKKYNKMSSIGLVIPEGLDGTLNVTNGVDNKIERDEIIRSDELFYEKENHRLLSKVGNDSGFLNSVHCLDKSSGYACSDLQDSEKSSQSTDSVELNDITSCSYTSSPSQSPNVNSRQISLPDENSLMQPYTQIRPANGYIKTLMSSGYIPAQALQNSKEIPNVNGYTTLDVMGKPIFPQASTVAPTTKTVDGNSYEIVEENNIHNKDIGVPKGVNGNICGYVTHKELSDFGQRLQ